MNTFSPSLPLLTPSVADRLIVAQDRGEARITLSLDLGRSTVTVEPHADHWCSPYGRFPYPFGLQPGAIYGWSGTDFLPVESRGLAHYRLVATPWGPPVIEVEGEPPGRTATVSPLEAARIAVHQVEARGRRVLDCWGDLGYGAHWCLAERAVRVHAVVPDVALLALRSVNPWSPRADGRLVVQAGNLDDVLGGFPDHSFDAILHAPSCAASEPGRTGPAPARYAALARLLAPSGVLVHDATPRGRSDPHRSAARSAERALREAGFDVGFEGSLVVARPRPAQRVLQLDGRRLQA